MRARLVYSLHNTDFESASSDVCVNFLLTYAVEEILFYIKYKADSMRIMLDHEVNCLFTQQGFQIFTNCSYKCKYM